MLQVKDLDLYFGDAQALSGVDLAVEQGEIVTIVGANGAGKTSLIRSIAGMHCPASGSIHFEGEAIQGRPSHQICNLGIGQVAEGRQVFPTLTVLENLEMGAVIPRGRAKARACLEQVMDLFPRLRQRVKQQAGTLSGGEQQMLAIGRCLMGQPSLIMFDEPSLGLAPKIVQEVFAIIEQLNNDGITVLLVEQNVGVSLRMADRAYVLENGQVVLSGRGQELLHHDGVRQAYMGL